MPLSKCRFCGKKVPNPFRPYHERVCVVARKARGEYVSPEEKKSARQREVQRCKCEEKEAKQRPQKRIEDFGKVERGASV